MSRAVPGHSSSPSAEESTLGCVPFLSPAKLLVILVVALVVLGPDKLPRVAKQIGGFWGDFRKFRERLEGEVRGTFPDLPSTDAIPELVRSPPLVRHSTDSLTVPTRLKPTVPKTARQPGRSTAPKFLTCTEMPCNWSADVESHRRGPWRHPKSRR